MKTIYEGVRDVCRELARHDDWVALFARHKLNIRARDLARELQKPLEIDRRVPGFGDLALDAVRAIEPLQPARSLLYHALASPNVRHGLDQTELSHFPTPAEIEAVEDYVWGVERPSLQDIRVRVGDAILAVAVFAYEYRPAIGTVHQMHADMCYSRTGISRIGTKKHKYLPGERGYHPLDSKRPNDVRVVPTRYAPYIAVRIRGDRKRFGPLRFRERQNVARVLEGEVRQVLQLGDDERWFWVPIHKLFSGSECLRGIDLNVQLTAVIRNEKLRKAHEFMAGQGFDTGWHEPELSEPPFVIRDGIAAMSTVPNDGRGLLIPVPQPLVARAKTKDGKPVAYAVPNPPDGNGTFSSSLNLNARASGARSAPEYVHARTRIKADGSEEDLNEKPKVADIVEKGGYDALHYVDHTGDGRIEVRCPVLSLDMPRFLPAYALIAPPDFFPDVKQYDLMQWWAQSAPAELISTIWPENPGPPLTLADMRYPARVAEKDSDIDPGDDTISALVGPFCDTDRRPARVDPLVGKRASTLTDGAAGVFAPGWDCSVDRTGERDISDDGAVVLPGTTYLAGYGLGSPFPEDAKLCAALSSFWPAAAPDITRVFEPGRYATTTPLTDDVIGQNGGVPWDGIRGPWIDPRKPKTVYFNALAYGDYVKTALNGGFRYDLVATMTSQEYAARTLVMARIYAAQKAFTRAQKIQWSIFSFVKVTTTSKKAQPWLDAAAKAGITLNPDYLYECKLFKHIHVRNDPSNFKQKLADFDEMVHVIADPQFVMENKEEGWTLAKSVKPA